MAKVKRFSVYWFGPDLVKGSELQKVRPGIVISPDEMNDLLRMALIIPLTTAVSRWPFRVPVEIMGRTTNAACDQLRAIDKSRLKDHISELTPTQQGKVLSVLRVIIAD